MLYRQLYGVKSINKNKKRNEKERDYNISPCNNGIGIKACTEIYDSIQQVIRGFSVFLTCPVVHQILIMGFSWVFKYFTLIFRPICGTQDKIWRIYLFMPFKPSLLQSSLEMYIYMDLIHASDYQIKKKKNLKKILTTKPIHRWNFISEREIENPVDLPTCRHF